MSSYIVKVNQTKTVPETVKTKVVHGLQNLYLFLVCSIC